MLRLDMMMKLLFISFLLAPPQTSSGETGKRFHDKLMFLREIKEYDAVVLFACSSYGICSWRHRRWTGGAFGRDRARRGSTRRGD